MPEERIPWATPRQLVDMLGYGLMINSLALHRRRQALAVPAAA